MADSSSDSDIEILSPVLTTSTATSRRTFGFRQREVVQEPVEPVAIPESDEMDTDDENDTHKNKIPQSSSTTVSALPAKQYNTRSRSHSGGKSTPGTSTLKTPNVSKAINQKDTSVTGGGGRSRGQQKSSIKRKRDSTPAPEPEPKAVPLVDSPGGSSQNDVQVKGEISAPTTDVDMESKSKSKRVTIIKPEILSHDDQLFSNLLENDPEYKYNSNRDKRQGIIATVLCPTERTLFIQNSIVKMCKNILDTTEMLEVASLSNDFAAYIKLVVTTFPHVFCNWRQSRRIHKRKACSSPGKFSPHAVEALVKTVFTCLPVIVFRHGSFNVELNIQLSLKRILNLLVFRASCYHHLALETLESVLRTLLTASSTDGFLDLCLPSNALGYKITLYSGEGKIHHLFSVIQVIRIYWHHMTERCSNLAEIFIQILYLAWTISEENFRFRLLKHFPLPFPQGTLMMDNIAIRFFERVLKDCLTMNESDELASFCDSFAMLQFHENSALKSLGFTFEAQRRLNAIVMSNSFISCGLVKTRMALLTLLCKAKSYVNKMMQPKIVTHDFSESLLAMVPQCLPLAIPAFHDLIVRECFRSLEDIAEREGAYPRWLDCDESDNHEIYVNELSTLWNTFYTHWYSCMVQYNTGEEEDRTLLILTKELVKLADTVSNELMASVVAAVSTSMSRRTKMTFKRIMRNQIELVFFLFDHLEEWTQLIPRILERGESDECGILESLELIVDSVKLMPSLSYCSEDERVHEVQLAWLYYASPFWWPDFELTLVDSHTWRNASVANSGILLDSLIGIFTNQNIFSSELMLGIGECALELAMETTFYLNGSMTGILTLILQFNFMFQTIKWQTVYKFIQRILHNHNWTRSITLSTALASAIARLPCIISYQQDPEANWKSSGCLTCQDGRPDNSLSAVDDQLLEPNIESSLVQLLSPVVLGSEIEGAIAGLDILYRLKCHGREPSPILLPQFLYHLYSPSVIFIKKMWAAFREYITFNTGQDNRNHLNCWNIVLKKLIFAFHKYSKKGSRKELFRLCVGLKEFAKTQDNMLIIEVLKLVVRIPTTFKRKIGYAIARRVLHSLANANGCEPLELFVRFQRAVGKDFVEYCLNQFFGTSLKPLVQLPFSKGKRTKKTNVKALLPRNMLASKIFTRAVKKKLEKCLFVLKRMIEAVFDITKPQFVKYFGASFLAELLPRIRRDRRRLILLHALIDLSEGTGKILLQEHFPVYFPMILIDCGGQLIQATMAFLSHQGVGIAFLNKFTIQSMTNEMLGYFYVAKSDVLRHFAILKELKDGKPYKYPTAIRKRPLRTFIRDQLSGMLTFLHQKLNSPWDSLESKRGTLLSFSTLFRYVNKDSLEAISLKICSTLNALASLQDEIGDALCVTWFGFGRMLVQARLGHIVCQVFSAVCSLKRTLSRDYVLEKLLSRFLDMHRLQPLEYSVYYLEKYIKNQEDLNVLHGIKDTLTPDQRRVSDLRDRNHHVQYFAVNTLLQQIEANDPDICSLMADFSATNKAGEKHPPLEVTLGLLVATNSQCVKTRILAGKCLGLGGLLEAPQPYLEGLIEDRGMDFFDVQSETFGSRLIEELQCQLRRIEDVKDFHDFAYCLQEILKLYRVEKRPNNFIWDLMKPDTKKVITSMLKSKYSAETIVEYEELPQPIYGSINGRTYHLWLFNWIFQLMSYMEEGSFHSKLFVLCKYVIKASVNVATLLLPYAIIHALHDCPEPKVDEMRVEMHSLLKHWMTPIPRKYPMSSEVLEVEQRIRFKNPVSTQRLERDLAEKVLCSKAVLSVMAAMNKAIRQSFYVQGRTVPYTIEDTSRLKLVVLDFVGLSHSCFRTENYAGALAYIEQFLWANPDKFQEFIPYMQRIFIAMKHSDGIEGLAALRTGDPPTVELVLENLACGKIEDVCQLLKRYTKENPQDYTMKQALVQTYLSLDEPEMAYNLAVSFDSQWSKSEHYIQCCRAEACWQLEKWDELKQLVTKDQRLDADRWTFCIAGILISIVDSDFTQALNCIENARKRVLKPLVMNSSIWSYDEYLSRYSAVTWLQQLSEIEQVVNLVQPVVEQDSEQDTNDYFKNTVATENVLQILRQWNERLGVCQSVSLLNPILNMRKVLLKILRNNFGRRFDLESGLDVAANAIRDTLLVIAKSERRDGNYVRARNCIEQVREFDHITVTYEEAKYFVCTGSCDKAISILERSMKLKPFVPDACRPFEEKKANAKFLLLYAKLCDKTGRVGKQDNLKNYTAPVNEFEESEENHLWLANAYSRMFDSMVDPGAEEKFPIDLAQLNTSAKELVRHYSLSLQYGCKNVYHSMPRLLNVWLDCQWSKFVKGGVESDFSGVLQKDLTKMINSMRGKVPLFTFLTTFSQLISRLCHKNATVWAELKELIAAIIMKYPHQVLWYTIAISKGVDSQRSSRFGEINRRIIQLDPNMKLVYRPYIGIAIRLVELSKKTTGIRTATMRDLNPALPKLLTDKSFGDVVVPFEMFLNCTLPRKYTNTRYSELSPTCSSLVYISQILDEVIVMPSLQKPKKITFRGTDGKLYGIMCKAQDDLRKDSKVMEMNNVLNYYLKRDSVAWQRQLHIQTYAVVPLNEKHGLIEWVPDLKAYRQILLTQYKKMGIDTSCLQITKYEGQVTDGLALLGFYFGEGLRQLKPVMANWFLDEFSDPRVWHLARETFTRTAAVMSIFGYLIGLGDRHGENLLINTKTAQLVHVDFNCIFNLGESFKWPERVPFRLTQNMVNGMGVLGVEGTFRRSCEITLRVLRSNSQIFTTVLKPFLYDPLVEWTKKRSELAVPSGETCNDKALEHVQNFKLRLQGKRRNFSRHLDLALSVEAHVKYLIEEATSRDNLCQMFIGWGPYL